MRGPSMVCFTALCLSFMACDGEVAEQDAAPAAAEVAPDPVTPAAPTAPVAETPASEEEEPAEEEPAATPDATPDAGAPKPKIPKPTIPGMLHAAASTGELCTFIVDGSAKGTAAALNLSLSPGDHDVSCKRSDGSAASAPFVITSSTTTNVTLEFASLVKPPIGAQGKGTLIGVAMGGSCAWSIDGNPKTTASTVKAQLEPGTYVLTCDPSPGSAMTKLVTVKSGETAMASFKL